MSETKKSGLRLAIIVTSLVTLVSLSSLVVFNSIGSAPKYPEAANFLHSKFQDGKFIEGFTPGSPEYGFSLEALAQLSFAKNIDTSIAKKFLLDGKAGYLYSAETGEPIPGLIGKFLFASSVNGFSGSDLDSVLRDAKLLVADSGKIDLPYSSTFDYAWLILGLGAQGEGEIAGRLAESLSTLAREDGGFGFDQTEATTFSSVDATAMAILALRSIETSEPEGSEPETSTITKAIEFLDSMIQSGNHFVAFDAEDVNGTALALMAKKSVSGELDQSIHAWLVEKIQTDGGIGSPWVENAGDVFATAQGYLALEGKTYLDLLDR